MDYLLLDFTCAGAVVVSDIPEHCTAVGIPAKPIKFHEPGL